MKKTVNKNMKRKKNGFTLIELIVVIAILGILATIAVPRVGAFRADAETAATLATARTIASAVAMNQAQNGSTTETALNGLDAYIQNADGLATEGYIINYDGSGGITSITVPGGATWTPGADALTTSP